MYNSLVRGVSITAGLEDEEWIWNGTMNAHGYS